jgi:nicotinamidase-related amidase
MTINRENTIGLVIDLQEKILPIIQNNHAVLMNSITLLKGLRALNIPILVTQQNTKNLGPTVPTVTEVIDNFSFFDKLSFSCWRDAAFQKELSACGKKNVVIIGIEAHVCVMQTVLDLTSNNYCPIVVDDCIGSSTLNDKHVSLWRMRDSGAIITTWEAIIMELCGAAGTDEFRSLLKIVKEGKNA